MSGRPGGLTCTLSRCAQKKLVKQNDNFDDDQRHDRRFQAERAPGIDEVRQGARGLADDPELAGKRRGAFLDLILVGKSRVEAFELRMVPEDVRLLFDFDFGRIRDAA